MKDTGVPFRLMEGTGDDGKGSIRTWTQLNAKQLERVFEKLDLKAVLTDRWSPAGLTVASLTVAQLKVELQKRGLETAGRKDALVKRLSEFLHSDQLPLPEEDQANHPILIIGNIIKLWKDFEELAVAMKAEPGAAGHLAPSMFQQKAREWGKLFRRVTFDEHVTPYIHAMVYHVPQFLRRYKFINDLSCESVEQVMEYENRDLFAVLNNLDRKKAMMGPNSAQRRANLQDDQQTEGQDDQQTEEEEIVQEREDGYEEEEIFEEDDDEDA
ncbi:hypothetical protein Bbelb_318670 [Branchiostoma belcheri]|nr:hypothetical protein Bbelb_318670 [Branchiostoma belcheri]